jgi:hypothetical protein
MVKLGGEIKKNKILRNDKINIKFCPNCKGFEVKYVFGLNNFFGISPKMKCNGCNFEMPSFPILQTTQENLDTAINKLKKKTVMKKKKKTAVVIVKKNKPKRGKK